MTVAGLILAGGQGTRLGADRPKPLVALAGRTLLGHVLDRLTPAVSPVLISANDVSAFAGLGLPVVPDRIVGFAGPLAGLDAATAWLVERHPAATHLLVLPGDTPFLPQNLVPRLLTETGNRARVARHGGALQPTVALWPIAALAALPGFLAGDGKHSIRRFLERVGFDAVDFLPEAGAPGGDPFFNVNRPADLTVANAWLDSR